MKSEGFLRDSGRGSVRGGGGDTEASGLGSKAEDEARHTSWSPQTAGSPVQGGSPRWQTALPQRVTHRQRWTPSHTTRLPQKPPRGVVTSHSHRPSRRKRARPWAAQSLDTGSEA